MELDKENEDKSGKLRTAIFTAAFDSAHDGAKLPNAWKSIQTSMHVIESMNLVCYRYKIASSNCLGDNVCAQPCHLVSLAVPRVCKHSQCLHAPPTSKAKVLY
jgi:hypothetical protein